MIEDVYIQKMIDKLSKYELTPLERVILANDATVQSLLSVIFRKTGIYTAGFDWLLITARLVRSQHVSQCL